MEILQSVLLGLIQGLTEFLPVSSSGHLVIAQSMLNFEGPNLVFDVILHGGTMLAVLVYFYKDIWQIISALGGIWGEYQAGKGSREIWHDHPQRWFFSLIIIGSVPTGIIGLVFKDYFEALFSAPQTVAVMLLVTGSILFLAERYAYLRKDGTRLNTLDALLIGIAQGIAIIPGISRSGATISTGILRGIDRKLVASFSFILSIPAITGAMILELKDVSLVDSSSLLAYTLGTAVAFLSGLAAIKILLAILANRNLAIFSYYCWTVGTISLFSHYINYWP
ncbi:MAG: undecaprenyl-diphosphate phosphatase [bacterium]|nr:undecaprenyl-diphosphate phosphatase [bacterium]